MANLFTVTNTTCDVLIIGQNNPTSGLSPGFVRGGGRVICMQQSSVPSLPLPITLTPVSLYPSWGFNIVPGHPVMNGVTDREDLKFWRGSDEYISQVVFYKPSKGANFRVLADCRRNLTGVWLGTIVEQTPLIEIFDGQGVYELCQLDAITDFNSEPIAATIFHNSIEYLCSYTPPSNVTTGLLIYGSSGLQQFLDSIALQYTMLDPDKLPSSLSGYNLIVIDGSSAILGDKLSLQPNTITSYVNSGGKVLIWGMTSATASNFQPIVPVSYTVQAAAKTGYAIKNGTNALLNGLSNNDMYWIDGDQAKSSSILSYSTDCSSNSNSVLMMDTVWDWELYRRNGEQSRQGNLMRAARYCSYIDKALMRISYGTGFYLLNELRFDPCATQKPKAERISCLFGNSGFPSSRE